MNLNPKLIMSNSIIIFIIQIILIYPLKSFEITENQFEFIKISTKKPIQLHHLDSL